MNQKLETRAFERVAQIMQPGEQPVAASRVIVGKFSSGRLGTIVNQAALLNGGGMVGSALAMDRKQFIVVTNQRVIFLAQTILGGPASRVLGEVPREQVSLAEATIGFVSMLRLAFGADGDGVALTFPRSDKKNAEALQTAFEQAA